MRLFAGVPLPQAAVDKLAGVRLRLSAPNDGLRWSAPEQWHITVRFFGEVDDTAVSALGAQLSQLRAPPVEIIMPGLGTFGTKGILYAEVEPSAALIALHAAVERQVASCGVLPESHAFRPHVALARSKGRAGAANLRSITTPEMPSLGPPLRWVAPELLLYRSVLRAGGSEYSVIQRVSLTPDSAHVPPRAQ